MLTTHLSPYAAPLGRASARSVDLAPDLALPLTQARCLVASLCGLHRVPMNAALLAQHLPLPIRLDQIMDLLATLGIEVQVLQPKALAGALQPGRLLQVNLQARVDADAIGATAEDAPTPLLVSCQTAGLYPPDGASVRYAWVSIAEPSGREAPRDQACARHGALRRISAAAR